jgi:hypothetical protein
MRHPALRSLNVVLVIMLLTSPAWGGSLIATPAINGPGGGFLECRVANVSDSDSIQVAFKIYTTSGSATVNASGTILPHHSFGSGTTTVTASHCEVEVVKGGKKKARVSLTAFNAVGNIVTAVIGQ